MTGSLRAAIVERLAATPERLDATTRRAGVALAAGPFGGGEEWGPIEIVRHLIAVESVVWQARLRMLEAAAGDEPTWPWTEPRFDDGPEDRTLDEVLATFVRRRLETLALLAALDDAGWTRMGLHATYGRLDVAGLMRIAADHDDEHIATLERIAG